MFMRRNTLAKLKYSCIILVAVLSKDARCVFFGHMCVHTAAASMRAVVGNVTLRCAVYLKWYICVCISVLFWPVFMDCLAWHRYCYCKLFRYEPYNDFILFASHFVPIIFCVTHIVAICFESLIRGPSHYILYARGSTTQGSCKSIERWFRQWIINDTLGGEAACGMFHTTCFWFQFAQIFISPVSL